MSGAKDAGGNMMASTRGPSLTAAQPPPPPDQGPGGPIAVVTSSANPYSKNLAEILRTEGLNEFATIDVSTVSADHAGELRVVILGNVTVSDVQTMTYDLGQRRRQPHGDEPGSNCPLCWDSPRPAEELPTAIC